MDETWIHHFTSESYRLSAEWTAAGESHPLQSKSQTSAGKVLASVFWDVQGILFIDYLEKGRTINSEYYLEFLERLKEKIARLQKTATNEEKVIFHQDNATCHKSIASMAKKYITALRIATTPTSFSRSNPQRLLGVCLPQKNAPGKEIWLQWRSNIGNWHLK